ncbi:MAG TPA: NAD(P)-dependent oxidoreductase [Acidimicrobiales bacterium]|nr:NAD(P)-dependent oxidoreductase [Acidimicrobiales bacterium]
MLEGQKILITGASGRVAFPIARALAKDNEVWGVARFTNPGSQSRLEAVGVRPVALDVAAADFWSLPHDFSYVFHAAMASGADGWASAFEMNSQASGRLLYHCRRCKGFVFCSTGSIYQYQGGRPLTESDPPGVPRLDSYGNYSFSKVAGEAVCTWISREFGVPLTIIRICSTYGPEGGTPADRFERMLAGKPVRLHPDAPNNFNPIYEDDYVAHGIRALEVADALPVVVNWAGSETVSAEEYCAYMGELVGIEPTIVYDPAVHTALWPDVTHMHEVLGRTKVHWRDGFRRMIEARHPELPLRDPA